MKKLKLNLLFYDYSSFNILKLSTLKLGFFTLLCFPSFNFSIAQDDSLVIENFKDRKVVFADLGYTTAPFFLRYPYTSELVKLSYKNNFRLFMGLGFAYKWFSMRIGFPVLKSFRSKEKFGETKQFNLGFDFSFQKMYFDFEFKSVLGYSIQDAYRWDSTYTEVNPNQNEASIGTLNFAVNAWYFKDKNFKMNALVGKRAHYVRRVHTWYVKGTVNVFGADNNGVPLIPQPLQNPANSKTLSSTLSSFDFGVIPGYAYVDRINNWQFSGWLGIGGVVQSKFYTVPDNPRGFLGLAPRYDIRLMGGYSRPEYFIFLLTDFDNKSIRFSDLIYRQYFYSIKIVGGYRFPERKKKKEVSKNNK